MKKLLLILIAFIFGLSINTQAHDFYALNSEGDTIYYNIISSVSSYTVEVTYKGNYEIEFNNYSHVISIPDSVKYNGNYYKITSIGINAFHDCEELISVTIPNSVTSINDWAFYACTELTSVTIPSSITLIDTLVFGMCFALTAITIPNSVDSICKEAFLVLA